MVKETIDLLVKGGAATAGPPLGPKLGPMGINTGNVVAAINEKTAAMKGMDVPVKVIVDKDTKEFEITIGTPPTAALLKKEVFVAKGSGSAKLEKVGDIPFDHVVKIAQVKHGSTLSGVMKAVVKEIVGSCQSVGLLVDGKEPMAVMKEIDAGAYDEKISGKLELLEDDAMKARMKPFVEATAQRAKQKAAEKEAAEAVKPEEKKEEGAEEKKEEAPKEAEKKEEKKA
jgi:large subunit ribosomal protein L11